LRQLAARAPERYPLLLESVATSSLGTISVLFAAPRAALTLHRDGRLQADGFTARGATFLQALENWWLAEGIHGADEVGPLRFASGWALYLGYELAGEIEPRLELPRAPLPWVAFAVRTHAALVYDFTDGRALAVAEAGAMAALEELVADVTTAAGAGNAVLAATAAGSLLGQVREEDPQAYLARVHRAKEYIRAGDIYQANLSRPWTVSIKAGARGGAPGTTAAALYERLCAANPAPFAALAQRQGTTILSSSPERLVRVTGRSIDTRPIAGTRPRSRKPGGDLREMTELAAHPKERAEHIMLIDLERNDLGRVCEAGTVRVDEFMTIESYTHVHHIVSNVSGRLRADVTPIGAVRAVFPGGTITGCPKFRCMQIIAELEGAGRGAYTGSLGYLTRGGDLDLNILIRTMTLSGDELAFRAGAGIVADSDPEAELEETRAKARGLLAALGGV
jgi:4-amino-4-deoxychorismate synthase (2-amino-4-deoxychorismate-forming) component I